MLQCASTGLPAWGHGESGQIGNEAATANVASAGGRARPSLFSTALRSLFAATALFSLKTRPLGLLSKYTLYMTHTALARKWRPKGFASLVGQEHVVRALVHSLEQNRLHHAYLFTGTRGVGKTTLSRILATALNCELGITATPCGKCRACLEVEAGHCIDYVEMDAASNRGVEEMTALLEQAVYAPVAARFKVYMIDEVHMLTQHAFNAMLKTLEEPPPHIKFILATTDPKKVPVTVLSRCLQFNLKPMTALQIVAHLEKVLQAEHIQYTPEALPILARLAQGSLRDALSLTDQAIAYSAGVISTEALQQMFGTLDQKYLAHLLRSVAAGQGAAVLDIADQMMARGASLGGALQDLASLLHRIAWAQYAPGSLNQADPDCADIKDLVTTLTPEQVQLYYQIATVGRSELGLAPDEYAGFTMTLLRMLAFYPSVEGLKHTNTLPSQSVSADQKTGVTAPVSQALSAIASIAKPVAAPEIAVKPVDIVASSTEKMVQANPVPIERVKSVSDRDTAFAQVEQPASEKVVEAVVDSPLVTGQSPSLDCLKDLAYWPALVSELRLSGLAKQLAVNSELIYIQDNILTLRVHLNQLAQKHCVDKLQAALKSHFEQAVVIKTEIGATTRTAAQDLEKVQTQRQQEAQYSVENSRVAQDLQRHFDAQLVPGSVRVI